MLFHSAFQYDFSFLLCLWDQKMNIGKLFGVELMSPKWRLRRFQHFVPPQISTIKQLSKMQHLWESSGIHLRNFSNTAQWKALGIIAQKRRKVASFCLHHPILPVAWLGIKRKFPAKKSSPHQDMKARHVTSYSRPLGQQGEMYRNSWNKEESSGYEQQLCSGHNDSLYRQTQQILPLMKTTAIIDAIHPLKILPGFAPQGFASYLSPSPLPQPPSPPSWWSPGTAPTASSGFWGCQGQDS